MEAANDAAAPPLAAGLRLGWSELPRSVRIGIEDRLGDPVVAVRSRPGGFSPGLAAVLETATGEQVFVKAAGPEPNPSAPEFHRREAIITAALPPGAPASRLRWVWDDGADGWVVLAFDAIDGRSPAMPWRGDELELVLTSVDRLSASLTPSPVPAALAGRIGTWGPVAGGWWRRAGAVAPPGLDAWSRRHLPALMELERAAVTAATGETLLHLDLRADNLLIGPSGVTFVDWPHARLGAAWVDLAWMAPSVAMQGGPAPDVLMARLTRAAAPDDAALTAVVAAIAGFFTVQSLAAPPPGLPTLRAFQAAQAVVAREWLARRANLR